ncbi:MAG: bacterial regulatory, arsR family protein [Devosia sp.]|nr:bacterial regulatory, arsR family protein [Devosia sp.]
MVIYSELDLVFGALADPTRRGLVAQLRGRDFITVSELAAPLTMTLPAVTKHLNVLAEAGLVTRTKHGRTVRCSLDARRLADAAEWLTQFQAFWTPRLDRLVELVEKTHDQH